jgi:tripartite-type tricarboxylate transporter receptor subunit TctC
VTALFRHAFLLSCALCVPAHAQSDYPTRPIRFLVPLVPGGAADILARALGQKLTERLNQPVVIDNRPGAGQTLATEIAAKSAPDGYTILIAASAHTINPSLWKLRYDSNRDFSAIGMIAMVPNVLVIHPSVAGRSVKEFVASARAQPGNLTFGSSGTGSASHLSGELFRMSTGVQFTHIPYKGQGQVMIDMLGGHIKMAFPSIPASIQHIKSGKLIALGVTTKRRSSALPDLPTIDEAGVQGFEVSGWYGILGPAGIPKAIVAKLNGELTRILQEPSVRDMLSREGADPRTSTPEEFAGVIAADIVKWAKVVKAAGIKVE